MRIRLFHLASAVLVGWTLAVAGPAAAQGSSARITGTVKDGKGTPLEGVKVTITTASNTRFKLEITTDKEGKWATILGNAVPKYTYKFEKAGFVPYQQEKKIAIGSVETFDVVLYTQEQAVASGSRDRAFSPYVIVLFQSFVANASLAASVQDEDFSGPSFVASSASARAPARSFCWNFSTAPL